jgi:hypothetical protein
MKSEHLAASFSAVRRNLAGEKDAFLEDQAGREAPKALRSERPALVNKCNRDITTTISHNLVSGHSVAKPRAAREASYGVILNTTGGRARSPSIEISCCVEDQAGSGTGCRMSEEVVQPYVDTVRHARRLGAAQALFAHPPWFSTTLSAVDRVVQVCALVAKGRRV